MKCRRCGEPVYPGNAYCQTCSDAMTRRAQELEAVAVEKAAKPKRQESSILRTVAWITVIGVGVSVAPFAFFRAEERLSDAGKALNQLTDTRSTAESQSLASTAKPSLYIGRAQRTATLEAAEGTGLDSDAPVSTDSESHAKRINHFPAEVSAWITSLHGFEQERQTLAISQLKAADESPADQRAALLEEFKDQWVQLLKRYEKDPAPKDCADLAASYSRTLRESGNAVVNQLKETVSAATVSVNADAGEKVLVAPAQDSDQLLNELCTKFGSSKDFTIQAVVTAPKPQ